MIRYKIRNNVFETNSSSMHSIVISKNKNEDNHYNYGKFLRGIDYMSDIDIDEDGKLAMTLSVFTREYGGYYGRSPFGILESFGQKFGYAVASLCNNDEDFDKLFVPVIEHIVKEGNKERVKHGVEEFKYDYIKVRDNDYDDFKFGFVDHQSNGLLESFMKEKNVSLLDFLCDSRYIVIIDGDEYCIIDTIMDRFGDNNIEDRYF